MKNVNGLGGYKTGFYAALIVFAMLSVVPFSGNAQPGPKGAPRAGGPREGLVALTSITGQAGDWIANDDMVYDGMNLAVNGTNYIVKFPPHLGQQIAGAVKKGATITVNGTQEYAPGGQPEFRMVSMSVSGKSIVDTPPAIESVPPAEEFVSKKGTIESFLYDAEGRMNGIRLSGNTIVHLPPHVGYQVSSQLKQGDTMEAAGLLKAKASGEVMAGNYSVIHCQTLTFNGQQYMVR